MRKFLFILFFAVVAAWGAKGTYFYITEGFSISNISSEHKDDPRWEMPSLSKSQKKEIEKALSQDYFYLGKGHQAYAFESEDGQYVLKFLKFQKYRHHPFFNALPLPAFLDDYRQERSLHKQEKREALFKSWHLACCRLRNETQVLFIRINRGSPIYRKVKLYNKAGLSYELDLDKYVFMLQRKANLFDSTIERWMSNGEIAKARQLLDDLLKLYREEYDRGLYEEDRYIVRNTGVDLFGKPLHIDVGRFREDETFKNPKKQVQAIVWKTTLLQNWLDQRYPELGEHLKTCLGAVISAEECGASQPQNGAKGYSPGKEAPEGNAALGKKMD